MYLLCPESVIKKTVTSLQEIYNELKKTYFLTDNPRSCRVLFYGDRRKRGLNMSINITYEINKTRVAGSILKCHAGKSNPDLALFAKNHSPIDMCHIKYILAYIEEALPNAERNYLLDELLLTL